MWHYIRPERTHELGELLGALRATGCDLPALDAACKLLTPFGVDIRYGPRRAGEQEGRDALAAAERIASAIEPMMP